MNDENPRWKLWYSAVLVFLLMQILFYYWFTEFWQ